GAAKRCGTASGSDSTQAPTESGGSLDARYAMLVYQRICPLCMRVGPYLRKAWDHALLTNCLEHKVQLASHCPGCNSLLRRRPGQISQCGCGHEYSRIPARGATTTILEYLLLDKLGLS